MYRLISKWAIQHPKRVMASFAVLFLLTVAAGGSVFPRLKGGGFDDPKSDTIKTVNLLEDGFQTGASNIVVVVSADDGLTVDSPEVVSAGNEIATKLANIEGIDADDTASYWNTGSATLATPTKNRALVLARAIGEEDDVNKTVQRVNKMLEEPPSGVSIGVTGYGEFFNQLSTTITEDLAAAEAIALPLTLLLLLIVFGGLRAAMLPLSVGIVAIFGAFGVLFTVSLVTNVSIFSLNLVTALGLGLAVDYSLFIVSRFREELGAGHSVDEAVDITIHTAGRAITFSALTVAISLSGLLIFPLYFLRSFAYAGVGVIAVALLASVVLLPAMLKHFGNKLAPKFKTKQLGRDADHNFWGRLALAVMKRPARVVVAFTLILIFFGLPFLGIKFGQPDDRVLAPGSPIRQVSDIVRNEFESTESNAFPIASVTNPTQDQAIKFAIAVSSLSSVGRVDSAFGRFAAGERIAPSDPSLKRFERNGATWFSVVPNVEPISEEAEAMIGQIRNLRPGFETSVGGQSAALVDSKKAIYSKVPLAAGIVVLATFVLLFLMFGSLLVPVKAIVLNVLSLTATFGAMVWVFQDGHFSGVLNFTGTGLTDTSEPILMFCIAFGLSMDYEVFLLSRVKEEYDRTKNNELAIVRGLARTGRIVTAAALLLSVTFFSFATSHVTFIKLFGLGLGIAVLVDAFVIRATLVPALMKLAGDANWWAPAPLRALHKRFHIDEGSSYHRAADSPVVIPMYPTFSSLESIEPPVFAEPDLRK